MGLYVSQNNDSESICSHFNETIFLPESQYQGGQIENFLKKNHKTIRIFLGKSEVYQKDLFL